MVIQSTGQKECVIFAMGIRETGQYGILGFYLNPVENHMAYRNVLIDLHECKRRLNIVHLRRNKSNPAKYPDSCCPPHHSHDDSCTKPGWDRGVFMSKRCIASPAFGTCGESVVKRIL